MADRARVEVRSVGELLNWLSEHHRQAESVWLVAVKKAAGKDYIPYAEVVEAALSYGWIDSLPRALDETRTMLLLSPRKRGSEWSAANRARIEKLIETGRMHPFGLAKVEAAMADGSWDLLKAAETGEPPADLASALGAAGATEAFAGFSDAVRKRAIETLLRAKRPETRQKRIAGIVAASLEGRDPTAWRRPD